MRVSNWLFQAGASEVKVKVDLFIDDLRHIVLLNKNGSSMHHSMIPGVHAASSNHQFESLLSGCFIEGHPSPLSRLLTS